MVTDYQNQVDDLLSKNQLPQVYELSGPLNSADQILSSLKVIFPKDVIAQGGLIGTETGCVRKNDPGKLGEYRNGAMVIQLLDAAKAKIDPMTKVATSDGGLLWEATVFYHWGGGCY